MIRRNNYSLRGLVRRLGFSLLLIVAGSWLLLIPARLPEFLLRLPGLDWNKPLIKIYSLTIDLVVMFDFAGLTLLFLGFFMSFFYRGRLSPRLKRLAELGEDHW